MGRKETSKDVEKIKKKRRSSSDNLYLGLDGRGLDRRKSK